MSRYPCRLLVGPPNAPIPEIAQVVELTDGSYHPKFPWMDLSATRSPVKLWSGSPSGAGAAPINWDAEYVASLPKNASKYLSVALTPDTTESAPVIMRALLSAPASLVFLWQEEDGQLRSFYFPTAMLRKPPQRMGVGDSAVVVCDFEVGTRGYDER